MKVAFQMTVDDQVAFNLYDYTSRASYRRGRVLWGICFPVGMFLVFLILGISSGDYGSIVLPGVIVPALYSLWFFLGKRGRMEKSVRKYIKAGPGGAEEETVELEVMADGLACRSQDGESHLNWNAIKKTVITPDYYFIYVGPVKALILPKRKIDEAEFAEFRNLVEDYLRQAAADEGVENSTFDQEKLTCHEKPIFKDDPAKMRMGCGIVSLGGGVLSAVCYGIGVAIIIIIVNSSDPEAARESSLASFGGLMLLAGMFSNVTGVVFGFAGIFKKRQRKDLAVVGAIINVLIIILIVSLITFGLLLKNFS